MGKVILYYLIGHNCPEFRNWLLVSYFFKLTLGKDCLELCFWTVAFRTILTQLQKYQSLSYQNFKHNSAHKPCLNLTLYVCSSLTVTTQKANAGSPWIPCFSVFKSFYEKKAEIHGNVNMIILKWSY